MKEITKPVHFLLSMEKDNPKNKTGLQLRIWTADNGTTLLVRLFKHEQNAHQDKLWIPGRNNGQVEEFMLGFMKEIGAIKDPLNWDRYTNYDVFPGQDNCDFKSDCIYFAWTVQKHLINF